MGFGRCTGCAQNVHNPCTVTCSFWGFHRIKRAFGAFTFVGRHDGGPCQRQRSGRVTRQRIASRCARGQRRATGWRIRPVGGAIYGCDGSVMSQRSAGGDVAPAKRHRRWRVALQCIAQRCMRGPGDIKRGAVTAPGRGVAQRRSCYSNLWL